MTITRADLLTTRKERDDARDLAKQLWYALVMDHHGVIRGKRLKEVRDALDAFDKVTESWS